jgi:cell division protein FtsB
MFEEWSRRYGILVLSLAFIFVILFSENGLLDLIRMKRQVRNIEAASKSLAEENTRLKAEIERLKTDDKYLEEMARKRFGFIREGEKVYRTEQ